MIEDGYNFYSFVNNNPVFKGDFLGNISYKEGVNCTFTMTVEYELIHNSKSNSKDAKYAIKLIMKTWNQENNANKIKFFPKNTADRNCCPCYYEGILPQLRFEKKQSNREADIRFKFIEEDTSSGRPMKGFENETLIYKEGLSGVITYNRKQLYDQDSRDSAEEKTAAHEFGHALGLLHPGSGLVSYKLNVLYGSSAIHRNIKNHKNISHPAPYVYIGLDKYGRYVNGETDLMGTGLTLREFYFDSWLKELNKKYPKCYFEAKRIYSLT